MDSSITEFLVKAKKSTYAGDGYEVGRSRPNSHDFQYMEGALKYIDTYLGSERFAGEEALWQDDTPVWSMNYIGRVLSEGFSGDFLKEALLLVPEEYPFRGPMRYENGDYLYICSVEGDFHWFSGYEEVLLRGRKIYECSFHGGDIV